MTATRGAGYKVPFKQQPLGRKVFLHGLVVIEMVLRQVGKDGNIEVQTNRASLVERVA